MNVNIFFCHFASKQNIFDVVYGGYISHTFAKCSILKRIIVRTMDEKRYLLYHYDLAFGIPKLRSTFLITSIYPHYVVR